MKIRLSLAAIVLCSWAPTPVRAQAEKVFLRPEPGGPMGVLTAVAFSPDGDRLYATGFDKVVRVWALNQGEFKPSKIAYRVPVGPGPAGTLNALAVSPDGNWLAVGGVGVARDRANLRQVDIKFPALGAKTSDQLQDEGTIFVFNVTNERNIKVLRGHAGFIHSLAFLPPRAGKPPLLVSAAEEPAADPAGAPQVRVRLWDAAAATSIADTTLDMAAPRIAPGIAAWHTGTKWTEVRVALACADNKLRVWDVARRVVVPRLDGQFNNSAATGPAGTFLTASFDKANGVVRTWPTDDRSPPSEIPLPPMNVQTGPFNLPRDLATFPSHPGGPLDRAAVLVRRQGLVQSSADQDVLFLIDLVGNQILAQRAIGACPANMRRLAASPTGRHIAVADADGQQVRVYSTADLAANPGGVEPQVLRGVGANFQKVSFRKKGDAPGLFLQEAPDDGGASLVFDFADRRLVTDDPAWQKDSPDTTGWNVDSASAQNQLTITVRGPNFPARTVVIGENCIRTASALFPSRPGGKFGPLLAVAFRDDRKQPWLAVYDVQSGVQVRHLAGHLAVAHSLAFSADGRLLASAAADQTVSLWSMTSLDQVLGKAGGLPGVVVVQKGKGVQVARSPADGPLTNGTVIEGVVEADKVRAVPSPADFFTSLFLAKPGTDMVLRVRPASAAARDVTIRVGQGTDERHPLLSLFVTRDADVARRDWIGWTSMGPYDASSPRAEELLGWHFNPEKKGDPVAFARADKYQENYQKRGILAHVVRQGNVADALKTLGGRPPEMGLMIDGVDPTGPRVVDASLVRTRSLALKMDLDRAFPLDRVHAVNWRMDDGPWQPLGEPRHKTWAADLSGGAWGRGRHVVEVRLDVDRGTQSYERKAIFHYAPAAPKIDFQTGWRGRNFPDGDMRRVAVTTKSPFHLEARVSPGTPGEAIRVTVRLNDDPPINVDPDVNLDLPLRENEENRIEIKAVNVGASPDMESVETTVERLRVVYDRQQAAPQIALAVEPLSGGAESLPAVSQQIITTSNPKAWVVGQITADANLTAVTLNGRPLDGFATGKAKQFAIRIPVTLKPGKQTLRFQSQTQKSPVARTDLEIVYQPSVARFGAVRPIDKSEIEDRTVEIWAALMPPESAESYFAELCVNGKVQVRKKMPAAATELTSRITLAPGVNLVIVRLSNPWGAETTRQLDLRLIRPPVIVTFAPPAAADRAVLDVSADVESPADLPPTTAKVNDKLFSDDRLVTELLDREKGSWKVTLRDVELQEGENTLTLTVANRDGESRKPVSAKVAYMKPKPPAPVVRFVGLKTDEANEIPSPDFVLRYTVESASPLTRVELRGPTDEVIWRGPAGAKSIEGKEGERRVTVRPGNPTAFRLIAGNNGGESEARVLLQLPQRPVFVLIENLRSLQTPGKPPYLPRVDGNDKDGQAVFDNVPEGRVVLHGRILWTNPNDERARNPAAVRVYANNFQQIPVESQPARPGEAESTFTATVLLTRPTDNKIEVDLPGLSPADVQRSTCVVRRCGEPVAGRRLHLVVIGVGERNGAALQERALEAINAREVPLKSNQWQAPPTFTSVKAYKPLVGGVTKGQIINQLNWVKREIYSATADAQDVVLNEVVLLYYLGREDIVGDRHFLRTDDTNNEKDLPETGVACQAIGEIFGDARGAQVVMLDVARQGQVQAEALEDGRVFLNNRLGVLQTLWPVGTATPPGQMLTMIRKSWPEANNLGALAGALAQQVGAVRQSQMHFLKYLPGELKLMEFGGKR